MVKSFRTTFLVDRSPKEVFKAVTNVKGWWQGLYEEEIIGKSQRVNEEFTFRAGGGSHYSKQILIELVPDQKVVWLVTESELSFVEKTDEWNGTRIIFSISKQGSRTKVEFTHEGLIPDLECFHACSSAWQAYLERNFTPIKLITTQA